MKYRIVKRTNEYNDYVYVAQLYDGDKWIDRGDPFKSIFDCRHMIGMLSMWQNCNEVVIEEGEYGNA